MKSLNWSNILVTALEMLAAVLIAKALLSVVDLTATFFIALAIFRVEMIVFERK